MGSASGASMSAIAVATGSGGTGRACRLADGIRGGHSDRQRRTAAGALHRLEDRILSGIDAEADHRTGRAHGRDAGYRPG